MNKLFILTIYCLMISGFTFAQSLPPELNKVRELKLLESTREDVKRLFIDLVDSDSTDINDRFRFFHTKNAQISISYSSGDCSSEDDDWNVSKGKITEVELNLDRSVKPEDLGIDLSKFKREKIFRNIASAFVYHDKKAGIGYEVWNGKIAEIIFRPSNASYSLLCKTERVKKFYSSKSWFSDKLKERFINIGPPRSIAYVNDILLSQSEITADCTKETLTPTKSYTDSTVITVETKAISSDPTDVFTFNYVVSGGKIIGRGKDVLWDLSGIKPGTYAIWAGVDNGCGVCGQTITKSIVVKPAPDCSQK